MLDQLNAKVFHPLLHETFDLFAYNPDQPASHPAQDMSRKITLIEVTELGDATVSDQSRRRSFSLIFHEVASTYLPQRIYTIAHPALGRLDLFLVPIGPDQNGMRYQAVFN
jgi:hypothetical protein